VRFATIAGIVAASLLGVASTARALPPPEPPRSAPSSSPTPGVTGTTLPFGSALYFVLDDKVNSGTTAPGTKIRMHLKSALVVNGAELAAAGSPASMVVLATRKAESGDIDGAVQVHLDPFPLPGRGLELPIRAIHEYLTIELTAGQEATRSTTDTVADVFIPGHMLYHAFRRGRQFVLPPGSVLRAQTAATVDATNARAIVLSTPPPFTSTYDTPHADITRAPIYTPAPDRPRPLPKGKPTLPPTPQPTPTPSPEPLPAAAQRRTTRADARSRRDRNALSRGN
jgi:hypothetical protein